MLTLLFFSCISNAQVILGAKFGPNVSLTSVKDNNGFIFPAESGGAQNGIGAALTFDLPINDKFYFGTGIGFIQKNITVRNSGTSKYKIAYFQVPALLKYRTGKVFTEKLNLVFGAGPALDFKVKESVNGKDNANYMNLAKNKYSTDPFIGYNGNGKSLPLFSPKNIGLLIVAGAEYQLLDKLGVYAGFSINPSFLNMINPRLTYLNGIPVADYLKIKTTIISFDLGVKFATGK